MGKYKDKKDRARAINDLEETGRLLVVGADRNRKIDDEDKLQQFINSAKGAKAFTVQVMEDEHYGKDNGELAAVKRMYVRNLDECQALGEKILMLHKEIKKHAGINGIFYPFFPASMSQLAITSSDLLIVLAVCLVLFFLL
ncbi:hypothetical protein QR721_05100 [Aciduricibacillus chroicocephali]|uniref:Uncharacterized protein n=1 Tax=Aciduricibacillus chroicocephali TaxID=3054939 RepID=A0ABY9KXV0_9BACI|nr:hypothetical protein QR721_05100 [Bacillaceae bacterium 44XB]